MAHGHAAPASVKNAVYDVVTAAFNGEYADGATAAAALARSRRRRAVVTGGPCKTPPLSPRSRKGNLRCRIAPGRTSLWQAKRGRDDRIDFRTRLQDWLPKLVLAPSFAVTLLFVYGFIPSRSSCPSPARGCCPASPGWGSRTTTGSSRWNTGTLRSRTSRSSPALYIVICTAIGLMLAIFLDQKIRGEGMLRPIYLYPMALSFIVTGTAWKWFLDPGIGLQNVMRQWGWESFTFTWIKDSDMAIYTIVLAAVWQTSGFVMAMFLAGLRGIDNEILKAAQIDGASNWQLYRRIVIPLLRPAFLSAFVILSPPRHQVLRPRRGADRRRARAGHRDARDLHVFLHLHPEPDGHRRLQRGDHADDHRRDHGSLPLRRTEGEEGMSVASRTPPSRPAA
jgi:glucose/mannose transport system permease protein